MLPHRDVSLKTLVGGGVGGMQKVYVQTLSTNGYRQIRIILQQHADDATAFLLAAHSKNHKI